MANSYGGDAKDTTGEAFRKLFIGGLHLKTDEDGLRSFFGQWGELDDVVVMRDRNTKKSRGFGFVTYRSVEEVDKAQAHRPHIIDNKEVETKRPAPRDEGDEAKLTSKKIFVAKLPKSTTQEDLTEYFQQFGSVMEANIVMAQDTGESKGFGFVTFDDYDAVDKIILYKPHVVGNTQIEVKKGLTKEQMKELKDKQAAQQSGYGAMSNANGGMYGAAGPGTNFSGFPAAYAAAYPTVQPTNYQTGYGGMPTANNYGGMPTANNYGGYQSGGAVPQAPTGYTNFDASGGFGGPAMGGGYHPNAAYTNQGYNTAPSYGGVQPSYNPGGYNESGYQDSNAYGGANNYNASQRGGSSSSRGGRGGPRGGGGRGRGGWSGQ